MSEAVLSKQPELKRLTANKSYLLLICAKVFSRFGDSVDSIAYSWMVYVLTGSEILMGTLFALNFIPGIAFSLFTGVLVDRWPKKIVIMCSNICRGVMVILTALLYSLGYLQPWHLFIFTFIISSFECFATPAETSITAKVIPKELLLSGNSFISSASRTAELAGMGAAGGLIALVGISGTMLVDAFAFIAAALIFLWIRWQPAQTCPAEPLPKNPNESYWHQFKTGLNFVKGHKLLILTMLSATFVNLCLTPFNVLKPVYVEKILQSGPFGLSLLGISIVVGMIVSGLWVSHKGASFKKSTLIVFGNMLLGIMYALHYVPGWIPHHSLYAAAFFSFGIGFAISFINTPVSTYMMEVTPEDKLGRVSALSSMVSTCAIPVGSLIAGGVGSWIGVHVLFLVFGLFMVIPGLYLLSQKSFMKI